MLPSANEDHPDCPSPKPDNAHPYTVEAGDTLGHLAIEFDTSVEILKKWNGIAMSSDNIVIGSCIWVP